MPTDPKHGMKGALDDLGARGPVAENQDAPETEADLFGHEPSLPLVLVPDEKEPKVVKRAGPGRPAGSRNRSTEQMIKFLQERYGHPLIRLAELAATPIPVLAQTLGMKLADAAEFHRKCQTDLAPYMAQKLPQMVQMETKTAGVLNVYLGAGPQQGPELSADGLPMALAEPKTKTIENQSLTEAEPEKSETESRKDTAK